MIQNSIKNFSEHKLVEENTIQLERYEFYFRADAQNRIYRCKFHGDKESRLTKAVSEVMDQIVDKDIDKVVRNPLGLIKLDCFKGFEAMNLVREALILYFYPGQTADLKSKQIVCRCNKIDLKEFSEKFKAKNGDLKSLQKDTNAGLLCGGCLPLLEELSNEYSNSKLYLAGKSVEQIYDIISEALDGFDTYTHIDLKDTKILLKNIDLPVIEIEVLNHSDNLDALKKSLENYIFGKLETVVEVRVEASFSH